MAAAYVAGVYNLEQALHLSFHRSRLQGRPANAGRMLAVGAPYQEIAQLVQGAADRVSLAAANGPAAVTLAGDGAALEQIAATLQERQVFAKFLAVSIAYHSPAMDAIRDEFLAAVAGLEGRPARIPWLSDTTGTWANGSECDAEFWWRAIRQPVLFGDGIGRLLDDGFLHFVEISPHPVLGLSIADCMKAHGKKGVALASLRRGEDERTVMLRSLGGLYTAGYMPSWPALRDPAARFVRLPTYTWQRERHWFEPDETPGHLSGRLDELAGASEHPLLGARLHTARPAWEGVIGVGETAFLRDHVVKGAVVCPGAAYVEMALAAAAADTRAPIVLRDVEFLKALRLDAGQGTPVQCALDADGRFEITSASAARAASWTTHARGLVAATRLAASPRVDIDAALARVTAEPRRFYEKLSDRGFVYGPAFCGVQALWASDGEAVAEVAAAVENEAAYRVHPALLDAAFQVLVGAAESVPAVAAHRRSFLPTGIRELRFMQSPGLHTRVTAVVTEAAPEMVTGDIRILDTAGHLCVDVLGLTARFVDAADRSREVAVDQWLYDYKWEREPRVPTTTQDGDDTSASAPGPVPAAADTCSGGARWVLLADRTRDAARRLAVALGARGHDCTVYGPDEPAAVIAERESARGDAVGVIHLRSLDASPMSMTAQVPRDVFDCGRALRVLQDLISPTTLSTRYVVFVTAGAQVVDKRDEPALLQAPLWGIARTVRNEWPGLACRLADVSSDCRDEELGALADELVSWIAAQPGTQADTDEEELAFRERERFVHRLRQTSCARIADEAPPVPARVGQVWRAEVPVGALDSLVFRPVVRPALGANEVEVAVAAASLNFRDIVLSTSLVQAVEWSDAFGGRTLGSDIAGTVVRCGKNVTQFKPGDAVLGIAQMGAFASFTVTDARLIVRRPAELSAVDGSTIPVACITAWYSLVKLAQLRAGETVLIHAASGGVGLFAIQIAKSVGARIFATAGSAAKRQFVEALGVEAVMDSRTHDFADEVRRRTGGRGVDVVLNSIAGEAIARGILALAPYGRFVELGKADIYQNRRLELGPFRKNLSLFAFDLNRLCYERPGAVGEMLQEVVDAFREGVLQPLPLTEFDMSRLDEAMHFMAQARHIGKVVVTPGQPVGLRPPVPEKPPVRPDATYLITGGLGGLGLVVGRWLVDRGARTIVLAGRRAPSPDADRALAELRLAGARVEVATVDVTDARAVTQLVADIRANLPPLKGIVHAAMVLDDRRLADLDAESFGAVMAPKVLGAWHLHEATRDDGLEFFVSYSSVASLLGNPFQANYAAANAFLDAFAYWRRRHGLPATTINWGVIAGAGYVSLHREVESHLNRQGYQSFTPEETLDVLSELLRADAVGVMAARIDWRQVGDVAGRTTLPRQIRHLVPVVEEAPVAGVKASIWSSLVELSAEARRERVEQYLRDQVARPLGANPAALDAERPLMNLGLDSLIATELSAVLEREFGVQMTGATFLGNLTIRELATRVLNLIRPDNVPPAVDESGTIAGREPNERPPAAGTRPALEAPAEELAPAAGSALTPAPTLTGTAPTRAFTMSDLQQAYWLGQNDGLELGGIIAHVYLELDFDQVDIQRLTRALSEIVRRHDMLRALVTPEGQLRVVEGAHLPSLEVVDLSHDSAEEISHRLEKTREDMSRNGPSTDRAPMMELRIHRLRTCWRLHFSIALMACDGMSIGILQQELIARYQDPSLPFEPFSFSVPEYREALERLKHTPEYAHARETLLVRAAELPPGPELPWTRSFGSVGRPRFVHRETRLDAEQWSQFRSRCVEAGLTSSNVIGAAFAAVVARWSKSHSFTLNVLHFNRPTIHPDVKAFLGNFSSTLLIGVDWSPELSFIELARQFQTRLAAAMEHRIVSGVDIVRELNRRNETTRAAMPVVFVSNIGFETGRDRTPPWTLNYHVLQTPQVAIDHQIWERGGGLVSSWDVVEDLLPPDVVDMMLDTFGKLWVNLAAEPSTWHRPLFGLTPERDLQARNVANATGGRVPDRTLHQLVAETVRQQPDALAVIDSTRQLSYTELWARSSQIDSLLRKRPRRESRQPIAVIMNKGWEQVVAVLGALRSGAAYLPIDPTTPPQRMQELLKRSDVSVVLTQSCVGPQLPVPSHVTCIAVDEQGESDHELDPIGSAGDLAYVIYTSGSTGEPKGVMIDHRGAVNTIVDINERLAIHSGDRILALSSLSFDLSVYDIFGMLAAGGCIVMPGPQVASTPEAWLRCLQDHDVTVWNTVPAMAEMLADHCGQSGTSTHLRHMLLSGDWIPVTLPDRLRKLCQPEVRIWGLGGATEASIWSVIFPIDAVDPRWVSIPYGRPLRNQTAHVLDEAFEPCPTYVPGQLYLGGAGLALGYWGDSEKTAERFVRDPRSGARLYRTGDIARYLPEGDLEILGRDDFQIKLHGYRIELGEIESALLKHPGVKAAAVVVQGEKSARRLAAYVVSEQHAAPSSEELLAFLSSLLPSYMVPQVVQALAELPLSANGKVDRRALASRYIPAKATAPVQPRSEAESLLRDLWQEVLDVSPIGVTDSFFALGGTSLSAVRLMARVASQFGQELPISVLLQGGGTIAVLADILEGPLRTQTPAVRLQPHGSGGPFFLVHPSAGNVLCYSELARYLGGDRPVYALESSALKVGSPIPRAETTIQRLLATLRRTQATGPYLLGGWSSGGVFAFELARRLLLQGEHVLTVVLIDAWAPQVTPEDDGSLIHAFLRDFNGGGSEMLVRPQRDRPWQATLRAAFAKAGEGAPELDVRRMEHMFHVYRGNVRAARTLSFPRDIPLDVLLVRAQEPLHSGSAPADLGWSEHVNQIQVVNLEGNHYSLLREPRVECLASHIRKHFERTTAPFLGSCERGKTAR
jgi:amino acid adenylation domain-containing protein